MFHEPMNQSSNEPINQDRKRPSAVRSFGLAIGIGALFLAAVLGISQLRGDGDLLRLFTRQDQTWHAMQSAGVWRVGMDPSFPPFQYLDDDGAVVGYDVDLARRMAEQWGLELEIVPLGYDSLLDALQAGRIDSVVSALPYDPRGTRDFAFSPPYFEAGIRLAVRADSPITDTEYLGSAHLAVEWGSMGDMVGRRLRREDESIEIVPFETPGEAIEGLLNDSSLDGLLIDNVSLRQAQGQGAALVAVGEALEGNAYVIAAPLRATTLQAQIVETLQTLEREGEFIRLEERWFGEMEADAAP
jgi:ABC-type amino acid transport substrate-binding protein